MKVSLLCVTVVRISALCRHYLAFYLFLYSTYSGHVIYTVVGVGIGIENLSVRNLIKYLGIFLSNEFPTRLFLRMFCYVSFPPLSLFLSLSP